MIKKTISVLLLSVVLSAVYAMDGDNILRKIDENITAESRIVTSSMIIHGRRSSRTVRAKSWVQGTEKSFSEYLSPPREAGTKMLKLGDELWIYSPSADRTIQISGHMLREPVMGSDLSYEDYMEDPLLSNIYNAEVENEEKMLDRNCYILYLTAKRDDIAYHYRRLWVDKERFIPLREEWFGKGGTLLKTIAVHEVMQKQGRWFSQKAVFKDELKTGKGTELTIEEIEFDANIPDSIFSRAALRR